MEKIQKDISETFIGEISNKNSVVVEVGSRHTGKTLFAMSILSHCLKNELFDSYHLVLPTYQYQRYNTFRWIEELTDKQQNKITIYESFGLFIIDDLINNRQKNGNTLFMVDDATSFLELFQSNKSLRKLITESRHLSVSTWLISHSLRSTINPLIRSNTSYYLLHKQSNANFLSGLWEENISLFLDKKEFMAMCKDRMLNDSYVCIVIDSDRSVVDCNAMDWGFVKKERDLLLKANSKIYKKDNDKKHKEDNKTQQVIPKPKNRPSILSIPTFKSR